MRFSLRSDAERIERREREPRFDWMPVDSANKLRLPVSDKFTGCIEAAQIDERCHLDVGQGDGSGSTQKQARHAPDDWVGNSHTTQLQNSPTAKVSRRRYRSAQPPREKPSSARGHSSQAHRQAFLALSDAADAKTAHDKPTARPNQPLRPPRYNCLNRGGERERATSRDKL